MHECREPLGQQRRHLVSESIPQTCCEARRKEQRQRDTGDGNRQEHGEAIIESQQQSLLIDELPQQESGVGCRLGSHFRLRGQALEHLQTMLGADCRQCLRLGQQRLMYLVALVQ